MGLGPAPRVAVLLPLGCGASACCLSVHEQPAEAGRLVTEADGGEEAGRRRGAIVSAALHLPMLCPSAFNQPLSLDTSSVTDMGYMFDTASTFNQPLSLNTSSVTNMHHMLSHASAFNSSWRRAAWTRRSRRAHSRAALRVRRGR